MRILNTFKFLVVLLLTSGLPLFAQPDLPPNIPTFTKTQRTLHVSPDGRFVAEISYKLADFVENTMHYDPAGTQVKLWDVVTGRLKWVKRSQANVQAFGGFSPDGKRFLCHGFYAPPPGENIVGNLNRFHLWDIETGQGLDSLELEEGEVLVQLAFTPDGKALVGTTVVFPGYLFAVKMWDSANGKLLRTVEDFPTPNENVLWPTNGNWLVTTGSPIPGRENEDYWIRVLSLPDLRLLHSLNIGKEMPLLLALSPDGKKLAFKLGSSASEKIAGDRISLWDIETNAVTRVTFPIVRYYRVNTLAFSPDGQTLITAGITTDPMKQQYADIWFWDTRTGALQRHYNTNVTHEVNGAASFQISVLPDGNSFVATNDEGTFVQRRLSDGQLIREFEAAPKP